MSDWEYVEGQGIWKQHRNKKTGELSLKEHKLEVVNTWCPQDNHDYHLIDMGKRLAECTRCGQEITFVVGKHTIEGDKVKIT